MIWNESIECMERERLVTLQTVTVLQQHKMELLKASDIHEI
jgi:hypothetical protein